MTRSRAISGASATPIATLHYCSCMTAARSGGTSFLGRPLHLRHQDRNSIESLARAADPWRTVWGVAEDTSSGYTLRLAKAMSRCYLCYLRQSHTSQNERHDSFRSHRHGRMLSSQGTGLGLYSSVEIDGSACEVLYNDDSRIECEYDTSLATSGSFVRLHNPDTGDALLWDPMRDMPVSVTPPQIISVECSSGDCIESESLGAVTIQVQRLRACFQI